MVCRKIISKPTLGKVIGNAKGVRVLYIVLKENVKLNWKNYSKKYSEKYSKKYGNFDTTVLYILTYIPTLNYNYHNKPPLLSMEGNNNATKPAIICLF